MSEPKKVYIITKGAYSDYHICAVAATKEIAEKLRKIYSDEYSWADARIEEYDLNEAKDDVRVFYDVTFADGKVSACFNEYGERESIQFFKGNKWQSDRLIVSVRARDEDHAIKIAQDRRAEYLAKKEGVV